METPPLARGRVRAHRDDARRQGDTPARAGKGEDAWDAEPFDLETPPLARGRARPRVDIVWLRVDDPAETDGSSVPAVVAGYTAGAPLATNPVPPATPARCVVLAWINVPLSGGGAPTVTWKAPYTVSAGGILPVPNWAAAEAAILAARP